jgi:hypothetical protein
MTCGTDSKSIREERAGFSSLYDIMNLQRIHIFSNWGMNEHPSSKILAPAIFRAVIWFQDELLDLRMTPSIRANHSIRTSSLALEWVIWFQDKFPHVGMSHSIWICHSIRISYLTIGRVIRSRCATSFQNGSFDQDSPLDFMMSHLISARVWFLDNYGVSIEQSFLRREAWKFRESRWFLNSIERICAIASPFSRLCEWIQKFWSK